MTTTAIVLLAYLAFGLLVFGAVVFTGWKRARALEQPTETLLPELHLIRTAIRQGRINSGAARLDELIETLERRNVREAA